MEVAKHVILTFGTFYGGWAAVCIACALLLAIPIKAERGPNEADPKFSKMSSSWISFPLNLVPLSWGSSIVLVAALFFYIMGWQQAP